MKKTKWIALLMLTSLCLTGCGDSKENVPQLREPVGVDVDTAKVKKMNLSGVQSFEGQVVPVTRDVGFKNSGKIAKILVDKGDKVKKGQLLATLTSATSNIKNQEKELKQKQKDNADANEISRCDISKQTVELKQLKAQLKKAKGKMKSGIKTQIVAKQEDIKLAKLRLRQQKAMQNLEISGLREDIAETRKQAGESKLYATFNGEVLSVDAAKGQTVLGGGSILVIANTDILKIQTDYIGDSKVSKASSYKATISGKEYVVKKEEQEVDPFEIETGNLPSSSLFDFVSKADVSVGESAKIDLYSDTAEEALVIPVNALNGKKEAYYVYRMNNKKKEKVDVTIGTQTDAFVQIISGLKEGDVVYVQD